MTFSLIVKKLLSLIVSITVSFYLVFLIIYASRVNVVSNRVRVQGIKFNTEQSFNLLKASKDYFLWLGNISHLSFGRSQFFGENVKNIIKERLFNTFLLNLFALVIFVLSGILLGVVSAVVKNRFILLIEGFFFILYAIPDFILAIFLILFFSLKLGIFPSTGMISLNHYSLSQWGKIVDILKHLILPALSLSLASVIFLARFTRNSILITLKNSYITALKVRGVDTFKNKVKHVLKNAIFPFISLLTFLIPGLVGGSIVIETIFGYPGIGRVLYTAIIYRDFPLLIATSFINIVVIYTSIFITDMLYSMFDTGGRDVEVF